MKALPIAGAVAACAAAIALDAHQQQPQQPVFRAALDVVTVDVSVRTGGTPVGGLTAKDFVLLDNGVRQTIDSIEMQEVPVDVSVLIDANEDVTTGLDSLDEQVRRIAARLRPSDRIRVTAINGGVADIVPARPAAALTTMPPLEPRGLSAAGDGIAAALLRGADAGRRHLIVAATNGIDAISTVAPETVIALARQSQAVLHIVQLDVALEANGSYSTGRQRLDGARMQISGLRPPTRLFWRPYDSTGDFEAFRAAAEVTGGALHLPGIFTDTSDVITKVVEDYRRSYLLRYTPAGAARAGWHEITVTVPAYPSYAVRARRGYGIETGVPGGDNAPISRIPEPEASPVPSALQAIVAAYGAADYARLGTLTNGLDPAVVIGEFRKSGNPWPANPTRESALVVELAEWGLHSRRRGAREAARDLLRDHQKLVRHPLGPDPFERYWLWAVLASLQGVKDIGLADEFVDYALTRFPDEPRFLFARAFSLDQSRAFDDERAAQGSHARKVLDRYDEAARFDDTAAEARLRKAFFLHRIERHADALAALDAIDAAAADRDVVVGYLHRLIRGRVLEALERFDEARTAYEWARQAIPRAQSPRVALMRLLIRAGDRPGAAALAAAIETAPADDFDPWWVYWIGDYRQFGTIVGRLREFTR